jgi:hypothetical protein
MCAAVLGAVFIVGVHLATRHCDSTGYNSVDIGQYSLLVYQRTVGFSDDKLGGGKGGYWSYFQYCRSIVMHFEIVKRYFITLNRSGK